MAHSKLASVEITFSHSLQQIIATRNHCEYRRSR